MTRPILLLLVVAAASIPCLAAISAPAPMMCTSVSADDGPEFDLGTCEPPTEPQPKEPLPSQPPNATPVIKTQPGLQCHYTCTLGGTEWTLLCSEDTPSECCDIAYQACPYLEPGSEGFIYCLCS